MPHEYQPPDFSEFFGSGLTGDDQPDLSELAKYAPQFPEWQLKYLEEEYGYAGEEYGLAGELYGMAQERSLFEEAQRGQRRAGAEEKLGLQLRGMGQQMGGTLAQSQESAYDIFGQGEQVAAGGLGARKGLTRRSMRAIEGSTERGLAGQAMGGLEAKAQYKGTLSDLASSAFGAEQALQQAGIGYESAGIQYDRAGMDYERTQEQLGRDWESDMYEYLLMLGQEFDYWAEGDFDDEHETGGDYTGGSGGDYHDVKGGP